MKNTLKIVFLALVIFYVSHSVNADENNASYLEYTVKPGDNLYKIARKYIDQSPTIFLNEFVEEIKKANNISDSNIIRINQVLLIPTQAAEQSSREIVKHDSLCGIYLNTYSLSDKILSKILARYDTLGCNALVIDFSNINGTIFCSTQNRIAKENNLSVPIISHPGKLANYLHSHGVELVARIPMFKDTTLAFNYPEWRPVIIPDSTDTLASQKKYEEYWLNPYNKDVQQYKLDIIKEVISLGVDEIQLDYVRFPTEGHLLDADYGIPDSLTKEDVITDFIRQVYEITRESGVTLSADIFGIVALQHFDDVRNTGQDIERIMPYLDRIHPMIYPSHFFGEFWGKAYPGKEPYYFIYRMCTVLKEIIDDDSKIIPYLESFSLYENSVKTYSVAVQIQAVEDAGLPSGFLFWNAGSNYRATWEALEKFQK